MYVPKGKFNYSAVIIISRTHIYGDGDSSILYASDQLNRALQIEDNGGIRKLKVTGNHNNNYYY